jgi:hypothetical protein
MSIESHHPHDPRTALVREKYFSLRPKPLERWLWQQGLPQAAERVFWLHWEEGMRAGDWCSQIPLKRVAVACCIDPSTATRAYQLLKRLGLIRREDPGRDPANPFQQATAVTEVRIPRALLIELHRAPNRPQARRPGAGSRPAEEGSAISATGTAAHPHPTSHADATPYRPITGRSPGNDTQAPSGEAAPAGPAVGAPSLSRDASRALFARFSAGERSRYFNATRDRSGRMDFDADTALSAEERAAVLGILSRYATQPACAGRAAAGPQVPAPRAPVPGIRRLTVLEAARLRKRLLALVPASHAGETLRQVLWAVEEGALRRFEAPLAINIALKKIREGAWSRPHRMPPNWLRAGALTEPCSAA